MGDSAVSSDYRAGWLLAVLQIGRKRLKHKNGLLVAVRGEIVAGAGDSHKRGRGDSAAIDLVGSGDAFEPDGNFNSVSKIKQCAAIVRINYAQDGEMLGFGAVAGHPADVADGKRGAENREDYVQVVGLDAREDVVKAGDIRIYAVDIIAAGLPGGKCGRRNFIKNAIAGIILRRLRSVSGRGTAAVTGAGGIITGASRRRGLRVDRGASDLPELGLPYKMLRFVFGKADDLGGENEHAGVGDGFAAGEGTEK